jgi:Na+-translocating ferredoxin:NAD+ oxidoreductase RNF subunit RnfB
MLIAIVSLGTLGLLFGGALAFASKKFAVEVDPRVEMVAEALPGANCGACGYPGCNKFAEEVVAGNAPLGGCPPGGSKTTGRIAEILGQVVPEAADRLVAQLVCLGDCNVAREKFIYHGIPDCKAAMMFNEGNKACRFGCLGLGTCARVCPFDAITMSEHGLPIIDIDKCTGCIKCKNVCPKQVLDMINARTFHYVHCKSTDRGKQVREVCDRGCIGCGICVKNCPEKAIRLESNLAIIDSYICINCGKCVEVCPRDTII